jgi:hypothetical protein
MKSKDFIHPGITLKEALWAWLQDFDPILREYTTLKAVRESFFFDVKIWILPFLLVYT